METGMTDKRQGRHTEHLRTKIAAGKRLSKYILS